MFIFVSLKIHNMKNLHLIETDKPSKLWKFNNEFYYVIDGIYGIFNSNKEKYNLYITSDEKVKEGDWCLHLGKRFINGIFSDKITLVKISERYLSRNSYFWKQLDKNSQFSYSENELRKIILTTDQELIKDKVQSIEDDFLEWFVKNPSCEFIQTERLEDGQYFDYLDDNSVIEGIYENYKI